jgi:hypothetical protein
VLWLRKWSFEGGKTSRKHVGWGQYMKADERGGCRLLRDFDSKKVLSSMENAFNGWNNKTLNWKLSVGGAIETCTVEHFSGKLYEDFHISRKRFEVR